MDGERGVRKRTVICAQWTVVGEGQREGRKCGAGVGVGGGGWVWSFVVWWGVGVWWGSGWSTMTLDQGL